MAADYPNVITNLSITHTIGESGHTTHHNRITEEVEAIQTELGTNPRGGATSVKTRIASIESDSRWTNSRVPTAHAATHKHGGSDEVAVAAAAANAIPKAGASGRLDIAWLGAGTPDGTKFLRDDGNFVVPPSGGAGSPNWTIVTRTSAYTAAVGDFALCNVAASNYTVTLPTAVGQAGNRVAVKKVNQSGGWVDVQGTSGQTLDGVPAIRIGVSQKTYVFISDGANWKIQGKQEIDVHYANNYGAKADGSDDRAAITAAINATPKTGDPGILGIGGIVMLNVAEYGIGAGGLVVDGRPVLIAGMNTSSHYRSEGSGPYYGTVLKLLSGGGIGVTFKTVSGSGTYQNGMGLENLSIIDHAVPYSSTGVLAIGCNMWHLKNVSGGMLRTGLITQATYWTGTPNVTTPVLNTPTTPAGGSLTNGQVYRVCITAQNATAETDQSNEFLVTPSGANLSIGLSWARITNATRYRVYIATGANGAWKYHGDIADPTATYTITSVAGVVNLRPPWQNETRTESAGDDNAWWYVEDCTWVDCCDGMFFYSCLSGKVLGGLVNGGLNQMALRVGMRGAQVKVSGGWYAVGASYIVCEGSQCSFEGFCLEGNPVVEFYHSNRPRAGAQDSNGASNNYVNNYQITATQGFYGVTPVGIWMHVDAGKTAYSNQVGMGTITGCVAEVIDNSANGAQLFTPSIFRFGYSTSKFGAFGAPPANRPNGVPVTAAGIHAALVTLGWITA